MKSARLWFLAGLPLLIVACAPADEAEVEPVDTAPVVTPAPAPTTAAPMDTGMAGMAGTGNTVQLMAVNNSNHTGEATLTASGEQTQVMVHLNGTEDRTHPGHIHSGTCANPGPVVVALEPITTSGGTGMATSTVSVPMATAMDGQHIVQYHAPDGTPVACGNIPQMSGGTTM